MFAKSLVTGKFGMIMIVSLNFEIPTACGLKYSHRWNGGLSGEDFIGSGESNNRNGAEVTRDSARVFSFRFLRPFCLETKRASNQINKFSLKINKC